MSWAKAVGQSLGEHYVKSKGRNMAQSHFLMLMNGQMQGRKPKAYSGDVHEVEALRRRFEPLVVAEVRRSYPDFSPERWSFWEPWERQGLVRVNEGEIEVITFERNAGDSRVRYRRLPPPSIAIAPGEMPPSWPLEECDSQDFTERDQAHSVGHG